jgi:hypothetical protein
MAGKGKIVESVDEIWADDILARRADAEMLIQYIESNSGITVSREDSHTYTIAIEAPYGFGKTFFLKRLERHLALNHSVAYVDAWADDLTDEPLIAIAATLRSALKPEIWRSRETAQLWDRFIASAGTVSAIATKGLLKRLASSIITSEATEIILETVASAGAEGTVNRSMVEKAAGDTSSDVVERANLQKDSLSMKQKIIDFERGRLAVRELREALSEIVSNVAESSELQLPVVIIIDELDRCRPTYAVKLLEEVKHIFDVAGIVFVLGINGDQLAASLSASYGPNFDGKSYLRRFVSRTFHLAEAELNPLFQVLLEPIRSDEGRIDHFSMLSPQGREAEGLASVVSMYATMYSLSARDAFQFADILRTSLAISAPYALVGEYLLPLIASMVKGARPGVLMEPSSQSAIPIFRYYDSLREVQNIDAITLAKAMEKNAKTPRDVLRRHVSEARNDAIARRMLEARSQGGDKQGRSFGPDSYSRLLSSVGRFK